MDVEGSWRAIAAAAGKQREQLKNVVSELKELIARREFKRTWVGCEHSNIIVVKVKSHQLEDRKKAGEGKRLPMEPAAVPVQANAYADVVANTMRQLETPADVRWSGGPGPRWSLEVACHVSCGPSCWKGTAWMWT